MSLILQCRKHPRYKAMRRPMALSGMGCSCWRLWNIACAAKAAEETMIVVTPGIKRWRKRR